MSWKVYDAGGDNNNCMILSVLACAPQELGPCTAARARAVRQVIAAMISSSAGTVLGKQAHDAMRVLHAWKTANPAEFTSDVSCPCADHCMHIEDEAECLQAAGKFVQGHHAMLGAIELPFLKDFASSKGVHVIEVTSESGGLDAETAAWVQAQIALAPRDKKVAVIVSDSVHYQALLPSPPRKAPPPAPRKKSAAPGGPVSSVQASPKAADTWTMYDAMFYVTAGVVLWIAMRSFIVPRAQ